MQELQRYSEAQRKVIEKYWDKIRMTRKTGKIADGVKEKEYAYWAKYPADVVIEALQIHIARYPKINERYTRGIMRNLKGSDSNNGANQSNNGSDARKNQSVHRSSEPRDADARAEEAFKRRMSSI